MGAVSGTNQKPKGLETAGRVRRAALSLFAQSGYAAVSMRDIAARVGVRPGALYNHFPAKQDILKDLMLTHMAELHAAWDGVCKKDTADPLERFARFHIRYHLKRTEEVFIAYMELRNLEPDNFAAVETERKRYEDILTEILVSGTKTGRYAVPDPKIATRAIIAMLTGIPAWYRADGSLSAIEIEDLYWAMVRKAVAPDRLETPSDEGRMK